MERINRRNAARNLISDLLRQRIGWVGVQIGPQIVRSHLVIQGPGNGDHHIRRGDFDFYLVEPAPHNHLADFGTRNLFTNNSRQMGLPTNQIYCPG